MFARSIRSLIACGAVVLASLVAVTGCEDHPDDPEPSNTTTPQASNKDMLGTTWDVTPAESTVLPGTRIHFELDRNGSLYTPGPGSPTVQYQAVDGGTLADEFGIETDYVAGQKVGDYRVQVLIRQPGKTSLQVPALTAIVHVVAVLPANNAAPQVPAPAPVPAEAYHVDLSGSWTQLDDANTADDPSPVLTPGTASSDSMSLEYNGKDGSSCGCNAVHKVVPLGASFDCSKTTLAFDYVSGGSFGYTSNQSISIRFCKDGNCSESPFYSGDQFKGSEQTGHSNCAWETNNSFPTTPQITSGHNVIDLSKLAIDTNGACNGSFDTIDVHLQAYACFADEDQGSQTLSNVVLY